MKSKKKEPYILAQKPNLPIITWFVTYILIKIITQGIIKDLLEIISFGAIFTWAWLEIFQGVNNFRRILGIIIMALILFIRVL